MYHEHFGLTEAPFRITPHTEFFFAGANRGATLEALVYAITHDEGIVKVSGEVGSGKTMLCRMLMERLPQQVETVYLANPLLSRDDILFAIADDLKFELPKDRSSAMMRALQEHLIARYAEGRQVVLLVDEAHAMPADTLEEIRLLSNLESQRHKLLQIVLFGQPELNQILDRPAMRQLKDRITHHFALEPLVRADVAAYIDFRMRAAGYRGPEVFSAAAVRSIARASSGLTRRINILAEKSLLAAFAAGRHRVDVAEVRAAIRDAAMDRSRARPALWLGAAAAAVLLAVAVVRMWPLPGESPPDKSAAAPPAPAAAPAASITSVAAAAAPPPVGDGSGYAAAHAAVIPLQGRSETAAASATAAETEPDEHLGPLTRSHLQKTEQWLAATPDDHWFLQLLTTDADDAEAVERFLERTAHVAGADQLRTYRAAAGEKQHIGVIFGDYPSIAAANSALRDLPATLRMKGAYPRQVRRLR